MAIMFSVSRIAEKIDAFDVNMASPVNSTTIGQRVHRNAKEINAFNIYRASVSNSTCIDQCRTAANNNQNQQVQNKSRVRGYPRRGILSMRV